MRFQSLYISGIHCQALRIHAEANRIRHPSRGHHHGPPSQQPEVVGETHQGGGNRDFCQTCPEEHAKLGLEVWSPLTFLLSTL